jgi:hypothetical protein
LAQVVARGGEEMGLGRVGALGLILRGAQVFLDPAAVCDVAAEAACEFLGAVLAAARGR